MSQVLALDYGGKRTGIAHTDDLQMMAFGLTAVDTYNLLDFLKKYFKENTVEEIVIGEPKRLHGEASEIETEILAFIEKFKKEFPKIIIHRYDERFTSKMAYNFIASSGASKKKKHDKKLVDQLSATIILQDFLKNRDFKNF